MSRRYRQPRQVVRGEPTLEELALAEAFAQGHQTGHPPAFAGVVTQYPRAAGEVAAFMAHFVSADGEHGEGGAHAKLPTELSSGTRNALALLFGAAPDDARDTRPLARVAEERAAYVCCVARTTGEEAGRPRSRGGCTGGEERASGDDHQ